MLSLRLEALGFVFVASLAAASAPQGPWTEYILAPDSRTVKPVGVYRTTGNVSGDQDGARLTGEGSSITLDFGKEIGGFLSFDFGDVDAGQNLNLSFMESPLFVGPISDDSTLGVETMDYDGALIVPAIANTTWTLPHKYLRGGFRYATLWLNTPGTIAVSNFSTEFTASPHVADLRNYSGYFWCDDDLVTRIWYSGVYTVQLNMVSTDSGRQIPIVARGWANNGSLGVGDVTMVDGAKRDRAVWPGDMGVAVPTTFVGTYDLEPVKNALATMVQTQNPRTGAFAESGPPLLQQGSDTYHCWTLIGLYNYYLYTGDLEFVKSVWDNYTFAIRYLASHVDDSGLLNVTGTRDWARLVQGGHNSEANAIYYRVLTTATFLASALNDSSLAHSYALNATALKSTFNTAFWDPAAGLYRDNDTATTLHPQDANSLAVIFNLTTTRAQSTQISLGLTTRWGPYGAEAPELPLTISPFIGSFELEAHFLTNATRALQFLRLEWGYALTTNLSVQSSLLEGWTTNGSVAYRSYRGYGYDASYTSHAHGWSSGPTSALSFYVVGLQPRDVLGRAWSFCPNPGDLRVVRGGFETALGRFAAEYEVVGEHGAVSGWFVVPAESSGEVALPGKSAVVDGVLVEGGEGGVVVLAGVGGGNHSFETSA